MSHDEPGQDQTVIDEPTMVSVASAGPPVEASADPIVELSFVDRYTFIETLGKGGMGAVDLCRDNMIGREVALKRLQPDQVDRSASARFVREARLQGQVEHPAIVPVYDVGITDEGAAYFTMQRVRGETIGEILSGHAKGDPRTARRHPRHRMLTAFAQICLAIDFAHRRGIVHRDIKPANVMLGDYGEVFVLDWGIARPFDEESIERAVSGGMTAPGAFVGTSGYVAPELILYGSDRANRRTDVYALGALLYRILCLEPHHQGTPAEVLAKTVEKDPAPPSKRSPKAPIEPELDEICLQALARAPSERFGSARALHDALEAYLSGQRDLEQRRESARRHAEAAAAAAKRVVGSAVEDEGAREEAVREVGRALALDPSNRDAMRTFVSLISSPMTQLPEEAREERERVEMARVRAMGQVGIFGYGFLIGALGIVYFMGVRSWPAYLAAVGVSTATLLTCIVASRATTTSRTLRHSSMVLGCVTMATLSLLWGPLLFVPGLIGVHAMSIIIASRSAAERGAYIAFACACLTVPLVLAFVGVLPGEVTREGLLLLPNMTAFEPSTTMFVLVLSAFSCVLFPLVIILRVRRRLDVAEHRLHSQAWHFRRLLPDEA